MAHNEDMTHREIYDRLLQVEEKVDKIMGEEEDTHAQLDRGIADLKAFAKHNAERIAQIETNMAPWADMVGDVAAVGRVGKLIVRLSVAVTTVVTAVAAIMYLARNGISDAAGSVIEYFRKPK